MLSIDPLGLNEMDSVYCWQSSINMTVGRWTEHDCTSVSEEADTIMDVVDPICCMRLIDRHPGRVATQLAINTSTANIIPLQTRRQVFDE
jgi:Holliday junction resolvasome RuvABC ATP-dependent DNA helicase subunit